MELFGVERVLLRQVQGRGSCGGRRGCEVGLAGIQRGAAAFDEAAATTYASALAAFERGDFPGSVAILEQALIDSPADGPAQLLLRRARTALEHPPRDFDAVWEPGSK